MWTLLHARIFVRHYNYGNIMTYNPTIHNRQSIRLRGYDYSQPGFYFITICTKNRERLLGEISNNQMILSDAGQMVKKIWSEIPEYYHGFNIHEFIVMHNIGATPCGCPYIRVTHRGVTQHYNDATQRHNDITQRHNNVTQRHNDITQRHNDITQRHNDATQHHNDATQRHNDVTQRHNDATQRHRDNFNNKKQLSIPDIIHRFKTLTTKQYIDGVKKHGWTPFPGKFWQRNYYEHIIRNDKSLHRIREYIKNNPLNWKQDN